VQQRNTADFRFNLRFKDFGYAFVLSKHLNLPLIGSISFFGAPMKIYGMFRSLCEKHILHIMVLLDRVARCVERDLPADPAFPVKKLESIFKYNGGELFHPAVTTFLMTRENATEPLRFCEDDSKPTSQVRLMKALFAKIDEAIHKVWKEEFKSKPNLTFVRSDSNFSKWWAEVKQVLLRGAKLLDVTLRAYSFQPTRMNLLCGYHLTVQSGVAVSLRSFCEEVTGQTFVALVLVQGTLIVVCLLLLLDESL